MKTVTAAYLKANLKALLDEAARGETIVISRNNKTVAQLSAPKISELPIPKLGTGKGKVKIFDPDWARPMTDEEVAVLCH